MEKFPPQKDPHPFVSPQAVPAVAPTVLLRQQALVPAAGPTHSHDPSPDATAHVAPAGADDSRATSMGGYLWTKPDRCFPPAVPTVSGGVLNPRGSEPDLSSFLSADVINDDGVRPPNHAVRPALVLPLPPIAWTLSPAAYDHPATTTAREQEVAQHPLPTPDAIAPPPSPPRRGYDVTDPQIFWLNNRPYLLQCSVGKGGFGEVHRVEMMLPLGMEVCRDAKTGAFVLDEDGKVWVRRTNERSVPITSPARAVTTCHKSPPSGSANMGSQRGDGGGDVVVAADEAVAKALQLSEAAPDSMKFFSRKQEEVVGDAAGLGSSGTFRRMHRGDIESSGLGRFLILTKLSLQWTGAGVGTNDILNGHRSSGLASYVV